MKNVDRKLKEDNHQFYEISEDSELMIARLYIL